MPTSRPSTLDVFTAFIFLIKFSQYKDAFPPLPRFFFFDARRDLISFDMSQYNKEFDSGELPEMSMAMSSSFLMTRDTVKEMTELFLDAGLLEEAPYHFDNEVVYQLTLLGLESLNRFLHENSDVQNFLKASLGVTSTQTTAVPLGVVASMAGQYFIQVGLIQDIHNIISTTFNDGGVYQFTPKYYASAVTSPSRQYAGESDGVIALFHSSRIVTILPSPGDVPNEIHSYKLQQYEKYHHLLNSHFQSNLAAPTPPSSDRNCRD